MAKNHGVCQAVNEPRRHRCVASRGFIDETQQASCGRRIGRCNRVRVSWVTRTWHSRSHPPRYASRSFHGFPTEFAGQSGLASLERHGRVAQFAAAGAAGSARESCRRRFLDLHVHQLAANTCLYPCLVREVSQSRTGRDRYPDGGVAYEGAFDVSNRETWRGATGRCSGRSRAHVSRARVEKNRSGSGFLHRTISSVMTEGTSAPTNPGGRSCVASESG